MKADGLEGLLYSFITSVLSGGDPVPIEKEVEWAPWLTWMLCKSLVPAGNQTTISHLQLVAQSLYRLHCPGFECMCV